MRNRWFGLIVAGVALVVSLWAYPELPPRVATHWGLHGEPNGYSARGVAAFGIPLLILVVYGVFRLAPRIMALANGRCRDRFGVIQFWPCRPQQSVRRILNNSMASVWLCSQL